MSRRLTYILFFLCTAQVLFSQQLPLDFSDNNDVFIGFSGSDFAFRTVAPSSDVNRGGQFNNNGLNASQGFYIDLAQPITINSDNKLFTLKFYAFDPLDHNILLKLEDDNNTDVQVKVNFSVPSPSDWITVNFDFSDAVDSSDGTSPVDIAGNYSRITLFIDEGLSAAGTYIIDDISNGDTPPPPPNPNEIDVEYTDLVWFDEFDGTNGAIDSNKWFHQTQLPAGGNWFNGEEQHYTNRTENSRVENGFLIITAKKESFTDQGYTKQYTSARLNSKFAFTYGRVDVRARLPFGQGTWPAIWTLGKNINEDGAYWDNEGFGSTSWPACGEIDIMEHGLHALNEVSVALHTPSSFGATINTETQLLADVANDFHVYSMNWSPDKIVFLIDDIPFYSYNPSDKNASNWPFTQDQYLLLNIAMGGVAGSIDSSFTESSMTIDYVRVYQNSVLNTSVYDINTKFKVYPNPATSLVSVSSLLPIDRLQLYNTLGQLVIETFGTSSMDITFMKKGVYILKITSGNLVINEKLLINQ
ncbi:family 16 glycosylhydrolase [Winogradskyella jejuensis]|uniref:Por secretion system C-terminal sorting domain-containing protein n=1 Tax=Winogradskyella jejuensis TaxID=1089305 RepID=A0A1M5UTD1_9FLAO|nr:family 16 glycosylhydrolase [Winogradskyella jejuensis]SHH66231.1 Por secretion system C-terminal sorting domain-containing protein [Winogradskyella jejuensis]